MAKTFAQKICKIFAQEAWLLSGVDCHLQAEELADSLG